MHAKKIMVLQIYLQCTFWSLTILADNLDVKLMPKSVEICKNFDVDM